MSVFHSTNREVPTADPLLRLSKAFLNPGSQKSHVLHATNLSKETSQTREVSRTDFLRLSKVFLYPGSQNGHNLQAPGGSISSFLSPALPSNCPLRVCSSLQ
jgi:hypothetical protein